MVDIVGSRIVPADSDHLYVVRTRSMRGFCGGQHHWHVSAARPNYCTWLGWGLASRSGEPTKGLLDVMSIAEIEVHSQENITPSPSWHTHGTVIRQLFLISPHSCL